MIHWISNNGALFYWMGFVISWLLCKYWRVISRDKDQDWGDVFGGLIIGLLSWLGAVISTVCMIKWPEKPPKWL